MEKVRSAIQRLREERDRKGITSLRESDDISGLAQQVSRSKEGVLKQLTECSSGLMSSESEFRDKESVLGKQQRESREMIDRCKGIGREMDMKIQVLRSEREEVQHEIDHVSGHLRSVSIDAQDMVCDTRRYFLISSFYH